MKKFLVDGLNQYSYEDLVNKINASKTYYPFLMTNNLFDYFSNLILAIISDSPLTLIDSDINYHELDSVNKDDINRPQNINIKKYNDIKEVIASLQTSKSAISIFTSGTTGQPKKVIHSISTLTRMVRIGEKYKSQIWAFAYNPTHMAGLQVFFQAFENENTIVNVFNYSRNLIYESILTNRITNISATPTFYRLLLPVEDSFSTVLRVTLGGEKSDPKLHNSILKIFPNAHINNVYASTEAGSLFASSGDLFQIPQSIKDKFKVVNDELLIHKSLLGESENFIFNEDYYYSGDLIEWVDFENRLFRFKNRKNELINIGGYKVNPTEVEDCILKLDGVLQVLVYSKPNSVLGNILCADIKIDKAMVLDEVDIRKFLIGLLQDFKIPRRIKFVETLPLTRTGKIKRL